MKTRLHPLFILALSLAGPDALAQATSEGAVGSPEGRQPGSSAPRASEAVVVPPFTPATPGVAPLDTPTNATVGAAPSDSALRDSVVSAIGADSALQGARINVTVRDGVVTLSGTARDKAQAERARAVVEGVAGSSKVNASISATG